MIDNAKSGNTTLATSATDVTATATEVNVLDNIPATLTSTELGYVDGVTSDIQTQFTGKSANPHTDADHSGAAANLLTGLTPTFTNWTTNPGTAANLVDEIITDALTTSGVSKAAPGSHIVYDLTTSRRRLFMFNSNVTPYSVWFSDDNVTYYQQNGDVSAATKDILVMGKFRYVKVLIIGVGTTAFIKMRCYNIN